METILLLEKVHLSFESWFVRQLRQQVIPEDLEFSIKEMREIYLILCWKENYLWKEWCANAKTE